MKIKGKWFHSWNDKGQIEWQGQVITCPSPGTYKVQLYEWLFGNAEDQKIVTDIKGWTFYDSAKEMNDFYTRYSLEREEKEKCN